MSEDNDRVVETEVVTEDVIGKDEAKAFTDGLAEGMAAGMNAMTVIIIPDNPNGDTMVALPFSLNRMGIGSVTFNDRPTNSLVLIANPVSGGTEPLALCVLTKNERVMKSPILLRRLCIEILREIYGTANIINIGVIIDELEQGDGA